VGSYLGIGLSIIINLLNPEKILLGGGVMESGEYLLPAALEEAKRRSFAASYDCCQIEQTALGNKAGFIGAALWARDHLTKPR
jgi:glucokinase